MSTATHAAPSRPPPAPASRTARPAVRASAPGRDPLDPLSFHAVIPGLRRKARAESAFDAHEREADHVADAVMRAPARASCPCGGGCPRCRALRAAEAGGSAAPAAAPSLVHDVLGTPGQAMDAGDAAFLEPRFGRGFGGVRIHTGPLAEASADAVHARAYTVGRHVVFGAGEYRPGTADGRRLLAHELAHVVQQGAAGAPALQREDKDKPKTPSKPKAGTAAAAPGLDVRPAKNTPPCACLVFMHHDEPNARLMAQAMFEFCRYNLAIISPADGRDMKLPGHGIIDPNELYPRNVAEECWNDDKPCEDFLAANAGATTADVVLEHAQRRAFLDIKHCSNGFTLPIVALHNNTIGDTATTRAKLKEAGVKARLGEIQGKTFDDALQPGGTPPDKTTLPFLTLRDWLKENLKGVVEEKTPKKTKDTLKGGPFQPSKTNIFLWCASEDISRCHIGDPERPDKVVWVTNKEDFEKLRTTTANVVLQTRIDPRGKSQTDLSSLFVNLEQIIGGAMNIPLQQLSQDVQADMAKFQVVYLEALALSGDISQLERFGEKVAEAVRLRDLIVAKLTQYKTQSDARDKRLGDLRYVNIETPQSPYSGTDKDLRVQSFRDVVEVLDALGLNCCDKKAAEGETASAADRVTEALRQGRIPKEEKKK